MLHRRKAGAAPLRHGNSRASPCIRRARKSTSRRHSRPPSPPHRCCRRSSLVDRAGVEGNNAAAAHALARGACVREIERSRPGVQRTWCGLRRRCCRRGLAPSWPARFRALASHRQHGPRSNHTVRAAHAERGLRPTRSVAASRSRALSRRQRRSLPGGRRPRVLAASGVSAAPRIAASVRFTPSRAASLSPRRAPLWPALPPPAPQRRPARYCMRPGPPTGRPHVSRRNTAHHSAGVAFDESRRVGDGVKASATRPP
jgi:hypothetical protein